MHKVNKNIIWRILQNYICLASPQFAAHTQLHMFVIYCGSNSSTFRAFEKKGKEEQVGSSSTTPNICVWTHTCGVWFNLNEMCRVWEFGKKPGPKWLIDTNFFSCELEINNENMDAVIKCQGMLCGRCRHATQSNRIDMRDELANRNLMRTIDFRKKS